jgi:hypothetical protein
VAIEFESKYGPRPGKKAKEEVCRKIDDDIEAAIDREIWGPTATKPPQNPPQTSPEPPKEP